MPAKTILDDPNTLKCATCKSIKDKSCFNKLKSASIRSGKSYVCKECSDATARTLYNRDKNIPRIRNKRRQYYVNRTYGISLEQYEQILKDQDYKCKICEIDMQGRGNFCHFDHDHATGKNREFLCTNCNRGLGHFQDNMDILMKAISYLKKHKENDIPLKEGSSL